MLPLLALVAAADPQATPAAPVPSSDVVALSPEDRAAALEGAATRGDRELPVNGLVGRPHGEVGVAVDSRGGRSVYGATTVPIGQTGAASLFFSNQSGGRWPR